jgi:hypothetical protein
MSGIMNKLEMVAVCLLVGMEASLAFGQTDATKQDLGTADWSVSQAERLNKEPKDSVWKFMVNRNGGEDSPGSGELCEFHFADLRHSGQLSLVVVYDGGGTANCNLVEVFDKSASGIVSYDFDTTQDLSFRSLEDVNGDGRKELILDRAFAGGGSADHCIATWPVVYAWNGGAIQMRALSLPDSIRIGLPS